MHLQKGNGKPESPNSLRPKTLGFFTHCRYVLFLPGCSYLLLLWSW